MDIKKLRIIRKQNKFTQQQIADVLGVSRSAYNGYERGRRAPDIDAIEKLCMFYRISPNKFFSDEAVSFSTEEANFRRHPDVQYLSQLNKAEVELILNCRLMPEAERAELLKDSRERCAKYRD